MDVLNSAVKRLKKLDVDPTHFINKKDSVSDKTTLKIMQRCYELLVSRKLVNGGNTNSNSLDELFIEGFDDEQIWQQLELKINSFSSSLPTIAKLHLDSDLYFPFCKPSSKIDSSVVESDNNKEKYEEESEESSESDEGSNSDSENNLDQSSEFIDEQRKTDISDKKRKVEPKSEVDDEFFKLSEMEQFLDKMEKEELPGDEIDYFQDIPSDDDTNVNEAKYDDFFKKPDSDDISEDQEINEDEDEQEGSIDEDGEESIDENYEENLSDESSKVQKKVRFLENDDGDPGEENEEKTSFEQRESKLRHKIAKLEENNLSEKPWAYKGEVDATSRPVNSLLEEVLDVDLTVRPPPVITERVTLTLEQVIINRIKDSAFDDVERKVKPVHVPHELKKELVLNQEKSKFSLAEIYEQEFLKRQPNNDPTEESNKLTPEKEKIIKMMKSVFHKLDILSNFHYTPKPVSADIEIVSNMPAITMEEVTPVAMSDANLLAPQEVGEKTKRHLLGKDERTKTDKKRERRKKKAFLSHKFKNTKNNDKVKTVLKSRNVTLAVPTSDSNLKSSSAFFKKLQEDKEIGVKIKKKKAKVSSS